MNLEKMMNDLSEMTVLEAAELVKKLEDKWGVKAASGSMPMPLQAMPSIAAPLAEPSSFDVVIVEAPATRIEMIKAYRTITGLGLKEANENLKSLPCTVKSDLDKEEALKIKAILDATGAKVDLK